MALSFRLYTSGADQSFDDALRCLCGRFPSVEMSECDGADTAIAPCLELVRGDRANIRYAAVPEGPEAAPFDTLMERLSSAEPAPAASKDASDARRAAALLVFIAPTCPLCPAAVRAALTLAADELTVDVTIVDAHRFPEHAAAHRIQSVPTIVIDGALKLVGQIDAAALSNRLDERGSVVHRASRLLQLIEEGRFDTAATVVAENVDGFVSLWRDSTLAQRIGLLLTAETVLERSPRGLDDAVQALLPVLGDSDPAKRGDTVDLLGRIGHPAVRPAIERLLRDAHPDVAEAAAEVLEQL